MRKRHSLFPKVNRRTTGAAGLSVRARNREQLKHHHPDTVVCHRRLESESKQGSVTKCVVCSFLS